MAFVLSDRIKETTTTTSTGTYTLGGAVSGFETFTANLSNGDTTYYCCTDGTDFEVGLGTFASSGTTLARTTIISSSNSNNAVSWSSGTREIFCTLPGSKAIVKNGDGDVILADNEEIKLGADGDLVIRHAGSNSLIEDNGGGSLIVKANPIFKLEKSGTSELMIEANADGAVELYHDDSKKFETTSSGATVTGTLAATLSTAAQPNVTSLGTLTTLTVDDITINGSTISDSASLFIDAGGDLVFDAADNDFIYRDSGTEFFRLTRSSNDAIIKPVIDAGDLIFQQRDGTEVARVEDNGTFNVVTDKLAINGTAITSTAAEINKLDGVTATTTELNYVDVTTLGTVEASKAVTADSSGDVLFPDDKFLKFGTGGDLTIRHESSGSHSVIRESGSGNLYIDASHLFLRTSQSDGFEALAAFSANGSVELYHNNVKKFETTSDGATVTGNATITSTADSGPILNLISNDHSDASDFHTEATIKFLADNSADEQTEYANIQLKTGDVTDGTEDGWIYFGTKANGTLNNAIAISSDGGFYLLSTQTNHPVIQWNATGGTSFDIQLKTAVPTADRIITLPDTTGTVFTSGNPNDITDIGIQAFDVVLGTGSDLVFEGATSNSNETTLTVVDPTADRTVTLPDATGTVLTTGNSDTPTTTTSSSDADFVLVDDGGTMKKITPSNLGITSGGASKGFAVAMAIAL